MVNHPNRATRRQLRPLSPETRAIMDEYVEWVFAECMGEDEVFALGTAYQEATDATERAHLAAAIIYRSNALSDPAYRILEERGPFADERLCTVADELRLA